ncbi:MAG TPA: leucine-rich repeat domain-containing protein [bacterium]|nr:leucine-rich repeat domain-containing protein [bacterium]
MRSISGVIATLLLLIACTGCDNNEEAFPDPAFKACVEESLRDYSEIVGQKYNIENDKDLEIIKMIACTKVGIVSVKGAEKLLNVERLDLNQNQIESVEPLRNLKKLEILHLDINKIRVIEPLTEAENLRTLTLTNNYINDFRPLKVLVQLKSLGVALNCATDLSQFDEIKAVIDGILIDGINAQTPEKCQ